MATSLSLVEVEDVDKVEDSRVAVVNAAHDGVDFEVLAEIYP